MGWAALIDKEQEVAVFTCTTSNRAFGPIVSIRDMWELTSKFTKFGIDPRKHTDPIVLSSGVTWTNGAEQ